MHPGNPKFSNPDVKDDGIGQLQQVNLEVKAQYQIPEKVASQLAAIQSKVFANHPVSQWNRAMVELALAAKQERRNLQGRPFNCFVLTRKEPGKQLTDNLEEFLELLKKNISSFTGITRFQVLIEHTGHWVPMDFTINDQQVSVFCVSSAGDARDDDSLGVIKTALGDTCSAYLLTPDKNPSSQHATGLRMIQMDSNSCSGISLEHSFILSKLDLPTQLKELKLEAIPLWFKNGEKALGKAVMPPDVIKLAPQLYRVTQSFAILESFGDQVMQTTVSKKNLTLKEYTDSHAKTAKHKEQVKKINRALIHKRDQTIAHIKEFCSRNPPDTVSAAMDHDNHCNQWKQFLTMSAEQRQAHMDHQITRFPLKVVLAQITSKAIKDYIEKDKNKKPLKGLFNSIRSAFSKSIKDYINELQSLKSKIESYPAIGPEEFASVISMQMPPEIRAEFMRVFQSYQTKPSVKFQSSVEKINSSLQSASLENKFGESAFVTLHYSSEDEELAANLLKAPANRTPVNEAKERKVEPSPLQDSKRVSSSNNAAPQNEAAEDEPEFVTFHHR